MSVRTRLVLAALGVPLLVALQNVPPGAPLPEPFGMVPVGTIIPWWGRYENIPPGYEICDGKPPTAQDAIFKERKPDLRGQFLRGSDSPQAFNPRTYEIGGADEVTVEIQELTLNANQLPPHKHPMPHTHPLVPHVHEIDEDVPLGPPAADNHTHDVTFGAHQHSLAAHTHPLEGTWTAVQLAAGTDFEAEILVQTKNPDAMSGAGQIANSSPFSQTGIAPGATFSTGLGEGELHTSDLTTFTGHLVKSTAPFDATGASSAPETGNNATTQQPIAPGTATIDNRPAFTSVLWIIRIK